MISREKYLEALDIVESYHRQQRQINEVVEIKKTLIVDWDKLHECSGRLKNTLLNIYHGGYNGYQRHHIEDITINQLMHLPGCGKKSIDEFKDLMGIN